MESQYILFSLSSDNAVAQISTVHLEHCRDIEYVVNVYFFYFFILISILESSGFSFFRQKRNKWERRGACSCFHYIWIVDFGQLSFKEDSLEFLRLNSFHQTHLIAIIIYQEFHARLLLSFGQQWNPLLTLQGKRSWTVLQNCFSR